MENTTTSKNAFNSVKSFGECKPLPITYLFSRYLDSTNNPVSEAEPVSNTIFFTEENIPVANNKGGFDKKQKLIPWSTDENGVIKLLGNDCDKIDDIRKTGTLDQKKFFVPPIDAISFIFAAHGENWAEEAAKLFKKESAELLTLAPISFNEIRKPKDLKIVSKENLEQEKTYTAWYKKQSQLGNKSLYGFEIHKTRAVILTFSDVNLSGLNVKIWPHGSDEKSATFAQITKSKENELLSAVFRGSVDELPKGLYNIKISDISISQEKWNLLTNKTSDKSYTLKEKFRFDIQNIAGDFEIINCDPITIEETLFQQFPITYNHLVEHATQLARKNNLPGKDGDNPIPQGFQGTVHHISVAKSKAELVAGILGADDPSKKFWSYGSAISEIIPAGTPLKKNVDLVFQIKDFNDKLAKIKETREAAAKAKHFNQSITLADDFNINKASGVADDAADGLKSKSLASKFKIPARYLKNFDKYMGVVGNALTVNALGVSVAQYVKVSKLAKTNLKHMDDISIDYHNQVHEMIVPTEAETKHDIQSFLYYDKYGNLKTEQKSKPKPNKRLILNIKFDIDKHDIKPEFAECIQSVFEFMSEHKKTVTLIEGHTDSTNTHVYNMGLSIRRAKAVQQLLIKKGIDKKRIPIIGHGETKLIKEKGIENRAKSRRVVAVLEHKSLVPTYVASREGITNLEKMRAATVADELGLEEAIKEIASKSLDVAVGVLAVLPVPGARVAAAVIIATQAGVEVAKSAASWADETFFNQYFTSIKNNHDLLQGFNNASHANQDLIRPLVQEIKKFSVNKSEDIEITDKQIGFYLNTQFRLRAEAMYGLIGLMTRAANSSENVGEYQALLEKYKVKQFIKNFILNDQWIFPLRRIFPISLDEYWLYAINEMGFINAKPDSGFGLDKKGNWVSKQPGDYSPYSEQIDNLIEATNDTYVHQFLGAIYIAKFLDVQFANTVKAEFHKLFPIHHFHSNNFDEFANVFKPNYTELDNHNIYEHTAIYWRPRGEYNDSKWQLLEKKLASNDPDISPFDQIRVLVVLKKSITEENKTDKKDATPIFPIRIQISRTDGIDINGPVYKGITRKLEKGELLKDEHKYAKDGFHGAVFYPFYQFGLHTLPGIKPLATETTLGALDMLPGNPAEWYYRINGLENMRYMIEVTVGRLQKESRRNRTTRPIRVTGKEKDYDLSVALQNYSSIANLHFESEFNVTLDIDRLHKVPELPLDPAQVTDYESATYNPGQIQQVRDEALLLSKNFLTNRSKESEYPPLFINRFLKAKHLNPQVKIMMRLGGKGEYIYRHKSFLDVTQSGDYKSKYRIRFDSNNMLTVNNFDWDTPVEFIIMVIAPIIDRQSYIERGYDWRRIPLSTNLSEYNWIDVDGPKFDLSMRYIGTIEKPSGDPKQPINFVDDNVDEKTISKDIKPLRDLLRRQDEKASALCSFPNYSMAGKIERHFYAAHIRIKYQSLTGEMIDSIRPFGAKIDSNGKGNRRKFNFGFINIKSRGNSGIDDNTDADSTEFLFPPPASYIKGVPWVRIPKNTSSQNGKDNQKDPNPILKDWLENAEFNRTEKIKRVIHWIEEDTKTLKQPIKYKSIKD